MQATDFYGSDVMDSINTAWNLIVSRPQTVYQDSRYGLTFEEFLVWLDNPRPANILFAIHSNSQSNAGWRHVPAGSDSANLLVSGKTVAPLDYFAIDNFKVYGATSFRSRMVSLRMDDAFEFDCTFPLFIPNADYVNPHESLFDAIGNGVLLKDSEVSESGDPFEQFGETAFPLLSSKKLIATSPVEYAAGCGNHVLLSDILDRSKGTIPRRVLWYAISGNQISSMEVLISNSKRRVRISDDGPSPLQTAVAYSRDKIVRILLENGFDPNEHDHLGETAMHCLPDSTELTELLFEFGGGNEMRNSDGLLPSEMAAANGYKDVQSLLERWRK